MDFCKHHAATIIAEFDDVRVEKSKKKSNSMTKKVIYQKKMGATEHLRESNWYTDIKVPTSAIFLHISSKAHALNTWHGMTLRSELHAQ